MSNDPSKTLAEQADPAVAAEKDSLDPQFAGHGTAVEKAQDPQDPSVGSGARVAAEEGAVAKSVEERSAPADGEDNANTSDEVDAGGVPASVAGVVKDVKAKKA